MSTSLISVQGIGRTTPDGSTQLLREITLALEAGERLALAGPSGSGKSLLLRALVLLDPISSGVIHFQGKPVQRADILRYRRHVAYLPQRPVLFDGTVNANLRAPFALKTYSDQSFDQQAMMRLLERLGREPDFLQRSYRDLSGGEAQLVALLRAIQLNPVVLLLDEPTASLDPETTRRVEALLADWIREAPQQRAYLWVSHDPAQTERIATRVLRINGGHLIEE